MLMTDLGAQKVFAQDARALYEEFKSSGRTELWGCKLSHTESGYMVDSARFFVFISAEGKFQTSKRK